MYITVYLSILSSCWFPLFRAQPCKHWSQLRRCACTEQQEVCQVMCLKRHLSKLTRWLWWLSFHPQKHRLLVRPPPSPSWFLAFLPHEWHHLWAPVEVLHWDLATNRWTPAVWWPHARRDRCSTLSWRDARKTTLASLRVQAPCSSSWEHCSKQYLDVDDVDTDTKQQNVCLKPLAQSSNSSSLGGKRYLFP